MPIDATLLTGLVKELAPGLSGARIDKVQQPERDLLLLSLYTRDGNRRLLISRGVGGARLHFTDERYENPASPPMFCMLMRKHLVGARITAVEQPPCERAAILTLMTRDELGVESEKKLICELMGRSSNIILTDTDGCIIDCLRRADFGENAYRRLLPGMKYRLPPRPAKPDFFELTGAQRAALTDTSEDADKWLMDAFSGLSPLTAREIAYRAGSAENLPAAMDALAESVAAGEQRPYMLMENGRPRDFSFMAIGQYGDKVKSEERESFSALLDEFYAGRVREERAKRVAGDTVKTVRTLRDRQRRKLEQQRLELRDTDDREKFRRRGDLITANLWRVKKGDASLACEDYYVDGSPEVTIRLDPLKTPQQNSAEAYKKYKKLTAAQTHLTELIAEGEGRLDYLESVLDELSRAENERDVAEIRRELADTGIIKQSAGARKVKAKAAAPLSFTSASGLEILVGRSNAQNDELTTRIARRGDLWFHVKDYHGSHVILRCSDAEPDEAAIALAASLAAHYSQARDSGRVSVDYTRVRNVKKPSGAMPGKVIYTDYQTIKTEPALPLD